MILFKENFFYILVVITYIKCQSVQIIFRFLGVLKCIYININNSIYLFRTLLNTYPWVDLSIYLSICLSHADEI